MVVTRLPSAADSGSVHERTARPSRCTVQAPQAEIPHAYLVPMRPSVSRTAQRSGISGSRSSVWAAPLTVIVIGMRVSFGKRVQAVKPRLESRTKSAAIDERARQPRAPLIHLGRRGQATLSACAYRNSVPVGCGL